MDNLRRMILTKEEVESVATLLPQSGYGDILIKKLYVPLVLQTSNYQDDQYSIYFSYYSADGTVSLPYSLSFNTCTYYIDDAIRVSALSSDCSGYLTFGVYNGSCVIKLFPYTGYKSGSSNNPLQYGVEPFLGGCYYTMGSGNAIAKKLYNRNIIDNPTYVEFDLSIHGPIRISDSFKLPCVKLKYGYGETPRAISNNDIYYVPAD